MKTSNYLLKCCPLTKKISPLVLLKYSIGSSLGLLLGLLLGLSFFPAELNIRHSIVEWISFIGNNEFGKDRFEKDGLQMEEVVVRHPSLLKKLPRAFRSFLLIGDVSGLYFSLNYCVNISLLYSTNLKTKLHYCFEPFW